MITLFRKGRQDLLSKNSFGKYLIYAIGEIFLVVVGILIALAIKNQNELEKNELAVISSLKEIQHNLLDDIKASQEKLKTYLEQDSIRDRIMDFENPLIAEDYKSGNMRRFGNYCANFNITKNGYENLLRQIDKIPGEYKSILKDLSRLYVGFNKTINVNNERNCSTVYADLDYHYTQDWALNRLKNSEISDEEVDYYVNSKRYKKYVLKFMNDQLIMFRISQFYRTKAIQAYLKIDSLLEGNNEELPMDLLGMVEADSLVGYMGTYQNEEIGFYNKLYIENNELYSKNKEGTLRRHWKVDDNLYLLITGSNSTYMWKFDRSDSGKIRIDFLDSPVSAEKTN